MTASRIGRALAEIAALACQNHPDEAERQFRELLDSTPTEELASERALMEEGLLAFLPKRRARLRLQLASKLEVRDDRPAAAQPHGRRRVRIYPQRERAELRQQFTELSTRHIFQWSTYYRDCVSHAYSRFRAFPSQAGMHREILRLVKEEFASHANEIFGKGFRYKTEQDGVSNFGDAIALSLNGLQRFMELPVEAYSADIAQGLSPSDARTCRYICSSMLSGILEGFGNARFGDLRGWQALPRFPRAWAHYLGFVVHEDLDRIATMMEAGEFRRGMNMCVLPLARVIDQLAVDNNGLSLTCLPSMGQFWWEARLLEVSLALPKSLGGRAYLEVQCYMDQGYIHLRHLQDAAARRVSLLIGPLRGELQEWVDGQDTLNGVVVNTSLVDEGVAERASALLFAELERLSGGASPTRPITENYAKGFPLHNPTMARYFRVDRQSVRDLLRRFESHNGVRLWCSVRRSGKTTACFDLGSSSGTSLVIAQTCDSQDQYPRAGLLYQQISQHLDNGTALSSAFLSEAIAACVDRPVDAGTRMLLLVDEYETLFERMRLAMERNRELRYTVVQPLLSQLVAFSRQNLIVLIGQSPDAHFIMMDQNQLSPYVQQDVFPLFSHTPGMVDSEFGTFLQKVVAQRLPFDGSFCDSVYRQTSGHPWLTVNFMADIIDWLMERRVPVSSASLTAECVETLLRNRFTDQHVRTYDEYEFFRKFVRQVISPQSRRHTPWLYVVYSVVRKLALDSPGSLSCTKEDFRDTANRFGVVDLCGDDADHLLMSAQKANVFAVDEDTVMPRIPLLSRISAAIPTPTGV